MAQRLGHAHTSERENGFDSRSSTREGVRVGLINRLACPTGPARFSTPELEGAGVRGQPLLNLRFGASKVDGLRLPLISESIYSTSWLAGGHLHPAAQADAKSGLRGGASTAPWHPPFVFGGVARENRSLATCRVQHSR
jgi:hypothetical protein